MNEYLLITDKGLFSAKTYEKADALGKLISQHSSGNLSIAKILKHVDKQEVYETDD